AAKQSVAAYAAAERATIIVRPLSPERVPGQSDGQNLWRVGMQFVNIGNTAPRQVAIRLLIGGKAAIKIPSGATKAPKSPDWDASLINSHPGLVADIGPHESTRLWTNAFAESGLMGDDNSRTFFYGTVIYDDVFKTTHRREFCLTTFRAPGQAVPGVYYCDLHNCEDEQCDQ
ncbi:MAG TPA: hypothetical protein VGZ47_09355, partial [Gemmataceae bacterium]|nr:hypothetical protein [Gemmataceae bacterium]